MMPKQSIVIAVLATTLLFMACDIYDKDRRIKHLYGIENSLREEVKELKNRISVDSKYYMDSKYKCQLDLIKAEFAACPK